MSDTLFTLDQVRYRQVLEIDHLAILPEQVTTIVGKSGSGKSTLLRLLNRMISPDVGAITYRTAPITAMRPVDLRRRVVMLPQNPVIFEGSIGENVLQGRVFAEQPAIAALEVNQLLDMMEIGRDPNGAAANLSGGERQRVAIARVLAMQPDVLLLDEPTSALDAGTQETVIQHVLNQARACGTSVIMVTHAASIAQHWSDRVIALDAGRIVATEGQDD